MANQAAKKGRGRAAKAKQVYVPLIVGSTLTYILGRLWYFGEDAGWFEYFGLLITVACHFFAYQGLVMGAADGAQAEQSFDLLCITIFTQVGSLYSDYVWYIMLLVPLVLLYKLWGWVSPFLFPPKGDADEAPADDGDGPRNRKERRAAARGKRSS